MLPDQQAMAHPSPLESLVEERRTTAPTEADHPTRSAGILCVALTFAAVTSGTAIAGNSRLLLGDLVLVAALAWMFFSNRSRPFRVLGRTIAVFGIAAMGFIATTFVANLSSTFEPVEAALTGIKLVAYAIAAVTLVDALADVGRLGATLRRVLLGLLLLSVAQQVAHRIGVNVWPLDTYASGRWDRSSFPRSASLFSEPAYLSIFVVAATYRIRIEQALRRTDLVVAGILLGLAASLAGIALACVAVVLGGNRRSLAVGVVRAVPALALIVVLVAAIPATREIAQSRVLDRVDETAAGSDASGTARLVDSWVAVDEVTSGRFLTGVGLGQLGRELTELFDNDSSAALDERLVEAGGTWNVIANIYAEAGVIGLAALAAALARFGLKRRAAALLFVVCFATGTFAGWLWWFVLALLCSPSPSDTPLPGRAAPPTLP